MNTNKIIIVEPGKEARIVDLPKTLEEMQEIVGGYIEATYPWEEEVCIVCNDEGKLMGLTPNRTIKYSSGYKDSICGTFFVCDCSGEDFGGLSEEALDKYYKMFKEPESDVKTNDLFFSVVGF